ncbi:putative zinc-binding dehydrogenase [Colletotrichum sublineola]|uniref:Putative zinc-binding dehydrogenase n=1 Tax=Colletotrichum sublineola TaxID=1173701 RepID=A0A066XMB7_COLSU|nr:putative zinc-binding dehydrogenase [Colletotrichum sublineola]
MQPDAKEDFVPPPTHRAVVIEAGDRVRVRDDVPLPALEKDQFLVRTEFVAVNPSDTKMRGPFVTVGGVLGTDYAGTVVARGTDVTAVDIGDRVCGAQHANERQRASSRVVWHVQRLGRQGLAEAAAVHQHRGRVYFRRRHQHGRSRVEASGTAAARCPGREAGVYPCVRGQHGHGDHCHTAIETVEYVFTSPASANMIPIAACSPKNADQVKAYGAEETFDYRQPDSAAKIKAFTKNNLRYALDCITTVDSTTFCYAAIGRAGGKYVALDPFSPHAATRGNIKTDWVLGPTIFGYGSSWPAPYGRPPSAEIRAYGEKLWAVAQKLVDEGKLRHHPVKVLEESGLEQVATGMEMVKNGKLSGQKCVVRIIS